MAVNIKFDLVGNPEPPTIILATRNGNKLGQLDVNAESIELKDKLNDASEFTFTLNKYSNGKITNLWNDVVNFKLVYCKEWDCWFEITVELDEETETIKTVFCTQLGQAELSQLMLYNIEINTEEDIARDDYIEPTVLFDRFNPENSLLHRLLKDKAPHYSVIHVDSTIKNIQRMFSFDDISIYDAFQEIAEEIGCLFVFHSNSDENGKIQRTISVYDLESNCLTCGHRGEFTGVCPEANGEIHEIIEGYGDDTTIFVTSDELAENIQLTTDTDSVKNCFKLEAGDDLMTATIRNCNPNGTDYLWYLSDAVKIDMSQELVDKIGQYDKSYEYYQNDYPVNLNEESLNKYNDLVKKYKSYNEELAEIAPVVGYPSLMQAYYNTIDLELYLESSMMPTIKMSDTDAKSEVRKLIPSNLSPVSTENIKYLSLATADNIVLGMAKIVVDSRYKVEIFPKSSSFEDGPIYKVWNGVFKVTNYSDEEDTATSSSVSIIINDDYANFVQQKIDKMLNKEESDDYSISGLFSKEYDEFVEELKKYSLNCLSSFQNACQSCIDILIEQGVGSKDTWSGKDPNLYDDLYTPYLNKLGAIEKEMKLRQEELDSVVELQEHIQKAQDFIHDELNFENYLGTELWFEFCSFRREDKYSNDNYISDGLNNVELFDNALKFIENAKKEIYKSAELQHSISSTLRNLLAIDKFKPLVDNFKVGNWLRIRIDDEIYKLRLIEYSIDYGDFDNIQVEFSDVTKLNSTVKSIQGVLDQASKMASSYDSVQKQAENGDKGNKILTGWSLKGLDVTNNKLIKGADNQTQVWDEHGMLFRKYDDITDSYDDTQLKIVNSTMAITDDAWETVKTAVGEYYYFDPITGDLKKAYGVNGEVIVGKLILGEQLGIYNESGTMTFDDNGFVISNGINTFRVNPNDDMLLSISNDEEDVFYVDKNGHLCIKADGSGIDISGNIVVTDLKNGLASGTTVISGNCIQTGTVAAKYIETDELKVKAANVTGLLQANQINMTGSITWEDLSEDVQDEIYAQSSDVDIPNYIKETYIDATQVSSFYIKGNKIEAVIPKGEDDTGFILTGMYNNNNYQYLRIYAYDSYTVFSSPSNTYANWMFGNTFFHGNISFDSANVSGLYLTFS